MNIAVVFALQAQMPALLLSGQRYPHTQFSYLFLRSCAVFQAPVLTNGFDVPCKTADWLCSGRFYPPEHVRDNGLFARSNAEIRTSLSLYASNALETMSEDVLNAFQLRPIAPDEVNLMPKLIRFNH